VFEFNYRGEPHLAHVAWAERAKGGGWSNTVVWVLLSKISGPEHGKLFKVAIQPCEQSPELHALVNVSDLIARDVTHAAVKVLAGKETGDEST
jgi:hypothetical protein